ncbi:MAG: EAL domain-containing protein [Eubacterium sp.]|nr:EAL domain-containing protein [Eubacterium sp.]
MNPSLEALNRAFEKAFAHSSKQRLLPELLSYLGEELVCDRISIFENNEEGFYRNVYEWCREGVVSEQFFLQHLSFEQIGTWQARLINDEIITIEDVEMVKDSDPEVYELLKRLDIRSVIVSAMAFQGESFGFFVMENPTEETIYEEDIILPGIRYILSSLVYSDHLINQLERIGYSDTLTGAGNRRGLQNLLERIDHRESVGLAYLDVFAWNIADSRPEHLKREQMIIHAGTILLNLFGEEAVFRVGTTEFMIVVSGVDRQQFTQDTHILKHLLMERDLLAAVGVIWSETCGESVDELIRRANLLMYNEKREMVNAEKKRKDKRPGSKALPEEKDKASISLYQGERFFAKADQWLSRIFDENILMIVVDINFFRLYNDIFGRKSGNLLLESIADSVTQISRDQGGIAGYMGNDDFCLMYPVLDKDYSTLSGKMSEIIGHFHYTDGFAPIFGVYLSVNRQETAIMMYDRALSALSEIKGSYTDRYQFYSEEHFRNVRENKLLMMDARRGLEKGEFFFCLQPQVNERTGRIIGAEALMRWNHNGQVLSPRHFIGEMEKTGFIYSLDRYIWEQVCLWLKDLTSRGIRPVPVSVNVSRIDFYFADIADVFISLVEKYDLDPSLIGVEITESAFTDNLEAIRLVTEKLHNYGFRVYMDDFGSGSSSLSMLYKLDVDVLKTDIRFLSLVGFNDKATSIVESVISMAHMIGMIVIAEGVETQEQKDSLIAMGDNYVQGYFFYQPVRKEEFEAILCDPDKIGQPPLKASRLMTSRLRFREMMNEGILNDTLLDNIIGPAAVYCEENGAISIIQMNEAYSRLTGISPDDHEEMEWFIKRHYRGHEDAVRDAFHRADHSLEGASFEAEFFKKDGSGFRLRGKIFLLYTLGDRRLYMATMLQD